MIDSTQTTEHNEPINLTWSQELAASWSIFWPSWIASYVLPGLIREILVQISFSGYLVIWLAGLSVMSSRLVRKNYRSFFVGVLKEGEPLNRTFTRSEQLDVLKRLLVPYITFLVGTYLLSSWILNFVSFQTMQSLNELATLFLILIVGPAAIRWTMYAKYRGFRLQAYRHERKWDPAWSSIRSFRRNAAQNNDQSEENVASTHFNRCLFVQISDEGLPDPFYVFEYDGDLLKTLIEPT
jgi:hypothetical protein